MEALKPVKKAYEINLGRIEEGYMYSQVIVHADNAREARSKLLNKVRHDGMTLRITEDELNYINIPVVRCEAYDLYEFEGAQKTRSDIDDIKADRERMNALDAMMLDESIQFCYIQKGSFYRPNYCGYTSHKIFAGVYTKKEAISEAKSVREISVIPINIEEHNNRINTEIEDLKTRVIALPALPKED